jgi:hypothetical protein
MVILKATSLLEGYKSDIRETSIITPYTHICIHMHEMISFYFFLFSLFSF